MAVEGSVPTPGIIIPHLIVRDAAEAVEFYVGAFGGEVVYRSPSPSGVGEHIHLRVWSSLLQLSTEEPERHTEGFERAVLASPERLNGSTCVFQVGVADVDASFARAVEHGAVPAMPPTDMFWGDRYCQLRDPFGHTWALCKVNEILTPEAVAERLRGFAAYMEGPSR